MDVFKVEGNGPLEGEIKISGSKNSALPIFAACLLTKEPIHLKNIPNLSDDEEEDCDEDLLENREK